MGTTLPSLISPAAALVTAGVTRLVAPVWSFGPHGDGGTIVLQSLCASAIELHPRNSTASPATVRVFIVDLLPSSGELRAGRLPGPGCPQAASCYRATHGCQGRSWPPL